MSQSRARTKIGHGQLYNENNSCKGNKHWNWWNRAVCTGWVYTRSTKERGKDASEYCFVPRRTSHVQNSVAWRREESANQVSVSPVNVNSSLVAWPKEFACQHSEMIVDHFAKIVSWLIYRLTQEHFPLTTLREATNSICDAFWGESCNVRDVVCEHEEPFHPFVCS